MDKRLNQINFLSHTVRQLADQMILIAFQTEKIEIISHVLVKIVPHGALDSPYTPQKVNDRHIQGQYILFWRISDSHPSSFDTATIVDQSHDTFEQR